MTLQVASYWHPPVGVPVAISVTSPITFNGLRLPAAAPAYAWVAQYREDGNQAAFTAKYEAHLAKHREKILAQVRSIQDDYVDATFCCWEGKPDECHRLLFARFLIAQGMKVGIR